MHPVEKIWDDTCNIFTYDKIKKEDHSTEYGDVLFIENQKCRISRNTKDIALKDGTVMAKGQGIMLYITDTITIPANSKIAVTHMGRTINYAQSGEPFYYDKTHHQEIPLKLFEKYA